MKCSVIIPTRNRSASIDRLLKSLLNQVSRRSDVELIVVDNGSTDDTAAVVAGHAGVRYVLERQPGLHNARHRGMREAGAEILAFVDDDVVMRPGWLDGVLESFDRDEVALVGGKILPRFEVLPPAWLSKMWDGAGPGRRILPYLSIIDLGDTPRTVSPYYIWGANFSVRRRVLLEAGGFHPDSLPSDMLLYRGDGETWVSEFIECNGYKGYYNPRASVEHCIPGQRMTAEYFRARAYKEGVSDSYTILRSAGSRYRARARRLMSAQAIKRVLCLLPVPAGWEWLHLRQGLFRASRRGFLDHRDRARKDRALSEWIKRDNYLHA